MTRAAVTLCAPLLALALAAMPARAASVPLRPGEPPLPPDLAATHRARIPLRDDGPDSLNAAVSAAIGLYRMAGHA